MPSVARSDGLINTAFGRAIQPFAPFWERLQSHAFALISRTKPFPLRFRKKLRSSAGHGGQGAFAFRELDDAVNARKRDFFMKAAGPEDFELVDFGGGAKAEVDAGVGRRGVAGTAEDVGSLANASSHNKDLCTQSIAGGFVNLSSRLWSAASARRV